MPIHCNDLFAPAASPNEATTDAVDPISKQPSLKCCAVEITTGLANTGNDDGRLSEPVLSSTAAASFG